MRFFCAQKEEHFSATSTQSVENKLKRVINYVQSNFADKEMCADWEIHDSENDKGQVSRDRGRIERHII